MNFKFAIRPYNKACNHKHNQDWNFRFSSAFLGIHLSLLGRKFSLAYGRQHNREQDSNFMHAHTTHNSTSNITYWHIYLNKFLTNQNNMWEAFLHTQLCASFSPRSTYSEHFSICSHSPIVCVIQFFSNSKKTEWRYEDKHIYGDEIDKKGEMSGKFMRKKLNFLKQT